MSKELMKQQIAEQQQGADPITGEPLPGLPSLVDTDRINPKAEGGTYDDRDNVRVLHPVTHMERHGNLRVRAEQLDELKSTYDDRVQVMKLALKINNQILAFERGVDHEHPETSEFLRGVLSSVNERLKMIDRYLARQVREYEDPLSQAALAVKGIGPITVAALAVYIDIAKAAHASSLWKYCGYDKPSHERYEKGVAGGGNKTLRTVLYNTASVLIKLGEGPYREVYDRVKSRLAASENIVKSRNTQGKLVEVMWKDAKPSHRHGSAIRVMIKHFLADYWFVGRELAGLPTSTPYAGAQLGHQHMIGPAERGWTW